MRCRWVYWSVEGWLIRSEVMRATCKILWLHGFLQNGRMFSEKSSGLRKLLKKWQVQCDYIDGPVVLQRTDLPFQVDDEKWGNMVSHGVNRAWFYHSNESRELDLTQAIETVTEHIKKNGPYDGIVGFSQGAALATVITNTITELLPTHPQFKVSLIISGYSFTEPDPSNDGELRLTAKYKNEFTPMRERSTKMLFVYGASDNAVPSTRSKFVYNLYVSGQEPNNCMTFEHEGGHMVPNKKDVIRPIVEEIISAIDISK